MYFYNERPNLNRFSTPGTKAAEVEIVKNPQLLVKLAKANVAEQAMSVTVNGFAFAPADRLLTHTGALMAPQGQVAESGLGTFDLTPSWTKTDNADYYEVELTVCFTLPSATTSSPLPACSPNKLTPSNSAL